MTLEACAGANLESQPPVSLPIKGMPSSYTIVTGKDKYPSVLLSALMGWADWSPTARVQLKSSIPSTSLWGSSQVPSLLARFSPPP